MKMDYTVLETQLTGEYRQVYEKAQLYVTLKNTSTHYADDKMTELFDLLLTAQNDGKPVRKLVGSDTSRFCKDFFSDYTIIERLRFLPASIYRMAWLVFILELIEMFAADDPLKNFFTVKSDMSSYGIGILVGIVSYIIFDSILLPIFLKTKRGKTGPWYFAALGIFAALMIGSFSLLDKVELMLPVYPFLLGSGIYIIAFIIVRAVWRYKNYGTIFNSRKQIEQDSYYTSLENRDMEKIIYEGWKSRYNRLLKKGKITEEAYFEKQNKEAYIEKIIYKYAMPVLGIIMCVISVAEVAAESAWIDTLFYAAILGTIEYFIFRWIIRTALKGIACREKVLKSCEKSGMSLPAYIDEKLAEYE